MLSLFRLPKMDMHVEGGDVLGSPIQKKFWKLKKQIFLKQIFERILIFTRPYDDGWMFRGIIFPSDSGCGCGCFSTPTTPLRTSPVTPVLVPCAVQLVQHQVLAPHVRAPFGAPIHLETGVGATPSFPVDYSSPWTPPSCLVPHNTWSLLHEMASW